MADLSDPSSVFGDLAGEIGRNVYVPDPVEGYKLGELVDFHIDRLKIKLIQNNGDVEDIVYVPHDDVLPAEDDINKDVDDSCSLMYLNEGTLLDNCRLRYARKQIYTYVANILISINPYEVIPGLYSNENINLYHGKSIGTLPPHIFAIADKAHRELKGNKNSQSIIVSGESGGGKTESQKHILRYLCDRWGAAAGSIEQRLLDANPILEAFGNAKTIRNNNSSRFGKFVEIHFNKEYNVSGGFVSHYLLEKSRICHQNPGERNYHIFYQLIAGVDDELAENLYLKSPEEFNYLSQNPKFFANSGTFSKIPIHRRLQQNYLTDDLIDDYINFKTLQKNLEEVGIDEVIQRNIFSIISGILHLGNVNFEDSDDFRGGCCIDSNSSEYLKISARLFGLDIEDFRRQLTSKVIQSKTNSKGTVIIVPLKPSEARAARDAFAKAIYTRLFDEIVAAINNSIPSTDSQFFNERILKNEQELYRCEALNVPEVEFVDNQDCIELFESRGVGLLDLLDEEAKIPRGSSVHFTEEVHRHHISNFRILPPRRSRLRGYRNMRDNEGFLIRHYAGAVCYRTFHFLEKNNDTLHVNLEMIITTSDNPYLKNLFFPTTVNMSSKIPRSNIRTKVHNSIASKFRSQLNSLLSKLKMTGTHFVRCIKPNSEMKPGKFEGAQILSQLKSSGMTSVLKLMHFGFPSRISFKELYTSYQFFLPENLKKLDPRFFGRCLFHALGLSESDFQFGLTKVFFRTGKFAEFDQLLHEDENQMSNFVKKIQSFLNKIRWKKIQWTVIIFLRVKKMISTRRRTLIKIQSVAKGYLVRRTTKSQLEIFRTINFLKQKFAESRYITEGVSDFDKREEIEGKLEEFNATVEGMEKNIKENPLKVDSKVSENLTEIQEELDILMCSLRAQISTEKSEKIEIVEDESTHEIIEEQIDPTEIQEVETVHRQQFEDEKLEKEDSILQLGRNKREKEMEYLDDELIRRLAREKDDIVLEEIPQKIFKTESGSIPVPPHDSYSSKLSKLSHAELRTTLNTTNNVELLKACQTEFHRRLRFFSNWRLKHQKSNNFETKRDSESLNKHPEDVNENQNFSKLTTGSLPPLLLPKYPVSKKSERFFRIPLCNRKRAFSGALPEAGFWYTHFEGEFLVREILFKAKEAPVLMITGKDDINMTHKLLSETELLKSGCEIKKNEFEAAWTRFGGTPLGV